MNLVQFNPHSRIYTTPDVMELILQKSKLYSDRVFRKHYGLERSFTWSVSCVVVGRMLLAVRTLSKANNI